MNFTGFLKAYGRWLVPVGVLAIFSMMVLPMPTWVLDIALSFNLSLAVGLLVASLTAPSILDLRVFPVVLVLTTIFRLSLNVSSTRLILLDADAGQVIDAFGAFVAGNDYVVGGVIFAIIAFVQYMVIAKGAERVSEVAARFSLDAMPGHQRAIERDAERGDYDRRDVEIERGRLEQKTHLLGSMDGAMKFVKGDAVAGIFITAVNIAAGVCIGVFSDGMVPADAFQTYALLTIGDGLVSQIPACLIALTAGILVTRGANRESAGMSLADELVDELVRRPTAVLMSGAVLLLLGMVPNLPEMPLLLSGGLIAAAGGALYIEQEGRESEDEEVTFTWQTDRMPEMERVSVLIGSELSDEMGKKSRCYLEGTDISDELFRDYGIKVDDINSHFFCSRVGDRELEILFEEIPLQRVKIPEGATRFVKRRPVDFDDDVIPIEAAKTVDTQTGTWILDDGDREALESEKSRTLPEYIEFILDNTLRSHVDKFVDLEQVEARLDELKIEHGVLYRKIRDSHISLSHLTDICRQLLREDISLRRLPQILKALIQVDESSTFWEVINAIRTRMARAITHNAALEGNLLVFELDPQIGEMVIQSFRRTDSPFELGLSTQIERDIVGAIETRVYGGSEDVSKPVLLVDPQIRGPMQLLISEHFPEIFVVSTNEVDQSVAKIKRVGCISIGGHSATQ